MIRRRLTRRGAGIAAAWAGVALAIGYDAWLALSGLPVPGARPMSPSAASALDPTRMQDFRDALYFPIRQLLAGGDPYDPQSMLHHWPVVQEFDLYLPAHLWLHLPLALLPFRTGAAAMVALDAALCVLLTGWAVRWTLGRWQGLAWPLLSVALLMSQVGKGHLYLGQINPLVAVGVAGSLGWRDRPRLAAFCLALAWIKPQFGLPLTLLLLARGRRRTALAGTAVAVAASLPVVAWLVWREGGVGAFVDVLRRNVAYAAGTGYGAVDSPDGLRVDVVAVVSRLSGTSPFPGAELLVAVLVLGSAGLVLHRAETLPAARVPPGLADLVTVLAVVVALVHQPGDIQGALPAAFAVGFAVLGRRQARRAAGDGPGAPTAGSGRAALAVALVAVPFAHLYVVHALVQAVAGHRAAYSLDGVALILAAALAGAGLLHAVRAAGHVTTVDVGPASEWAR